MADQEMVTLMEKEPQDNSSFEFQDVISMQALSRLRGRNYDQGFPRSTQEKLIRVFCWPLEVSQWMQRERQFGMVPFR